MRFLDSVMVGLGVSILVGQVFFAVRRFRRPLMTNELASEMIAVLEKYYGCRVAKVGDYCDAFDQYFSHAREWLEGSHPEVSKVLPELRMIISKSCFLDRLVYQGEAPRTRKCPKHGGRWSGIQWPPPTCGCATTCCTTGWLPEPRPPEMGREP